MQSSPCFVELGAHCVQGYLKNIRDFLVSVLVANPEQSHLAHLRRQLRQRTQQKLDLLLGDQALEGVTSRIWGFQGLGKWTSALGGLLIVDRNDDAQVFEPASVPIMVEGDPVGDRDQPRLDARFTPKALPPSVGLKKGLAHQLSCHLMVEAVPDEAGEDQAVVLIIDGLELEFFSGPRGRLNGRGHEGWRV